MTGGIPAIYISDFGLRNFGSHFAIRMCHRWLTIGMLLLALPGAVGDCWGQTKPETAQSERAPQDKAEAVPTISIETREVILPVTVRDSSGRLVTQLQAEDFTIYEDGVPQPITSFALRQLPVHVVLLVDTSSSVARELEDFKAIAYRFITQLDPQDQVSIIKFDDKVELVQDWTSNRTALHRALKRLSAGMFTMFNDALWLAAREQLGRINGRKAIIVLTDGIDSGRGYISTLQAFRALVEAETAVYVVSKTRIQSRIEQNELEFYQNASASSRALNRVRIDSLKASLAALTESERKLARLAEETGGRIFLPESFDELEEAYRQVADELRHQYVISYAPTNSTPDGRYRTIRVKLRHPDYRATTRFGYYLR